MPRKGTSRLPEPSFPYICGDREGTQAGYAAHHRIPEQPCPACRKAHNTAERIGMARRRQVKRKYRAHQKAVGRL